MSELSFPEPIEPQSELDLVPQEIEEIEVEVVDDRPAEDQKELRTQSEPFRLDDEIDDMDENVKKRTNRLKYEYHQQRREKEEAQRMRDEAIQFAQQQKQHNDHLQGLVGRSEQALLQSVQTRTEAELETAKRAYKQAHEEGDTDAMVAAQEQMAKIQADRTYIQNYQPQINPEQSVPEQQIPQQQTATAPQQQPMDPNLVSWLQKNPWFGAPGNEALTGFAYGLDEMLGHRGIVRNSPEYFSAIDKTLRESFPKAFGVEREQSESTQRRTSTVVAPAQRAGRKSRKVKLSETQVQLAKRLGITNEQYAAQL